MAYQPDVSAFIELAANDLESGWQQHLFHDPRRSLFLETQNVANASTRKSLQDVTDDLSLAKFEADKVNDRYMSQILEVALEDVAVLKFLNEVFE